MQLSQTIKPISYLKSKTAESRRIVPELQHIGILNYRELIDKQWRIIYKGDILFRRLLKVDHKS